MLIKKDCLQTTEKILLDIVEGKGNFTLDFFKGDESCAISFYSDNVSKEFVNDLRTIIKGERLRVERKIKKVGLLDE